MFRKVSPLALLLLVAAAPRPGASRAHPDAGPNRSAEACIDCHARATPAVVREWEAGQHGLVLVKCFVCHGTTGADFRRAPDVGRCRGCHAAQVASAKSRSGKSRGGCFACHAPHGLSPTERKPNPHARTSKPETSP